MKAYSIAIGLVAWLVILTGSFAMADVSQARRGARRGEEQLISHGRGRDIYVSGETPGPTPTPTATPAPDSGGSILVVDDDQGETYEMYYTAALDALGRNYEVWNVREQGSPAATRLQRYDVVIWFTGDDYQATLTGSDRSNLAAYLDGGGNLFITAQDIGYDIRTSAFYEDYLHARYLLDDTNTHYLTGSDILSAVNVSISAGDGANNQNYPSEIGLGKGAVGVFDYDGNYGWGGLRWEGVYRVVYLSFGYEAIDSASSRASVMSAVLSWLEGRAPSPTPVPKSMPASTSPASSEVVLFFDDFEDDFESDGGWVVNPSGSDTATTGTWERADPERTEYQGIVYQLGTTASGSYGLVTGPLVGSNVGDHDVDGGMTTIRSPNVVLPHGEGITLTFQYYLAHHDNATGDDFLRVKVVGSTATTVLEELGTADCAGASWSTYRGDLTDFAGQTIYLLIEAADGGAGSLIEAALDDVRITQGGGGPEPEPTPTCTPAPVFFDDFESDRGWTVDPSGDDTATMGTWERADPQGTQHGGLTYQLGTAASGDYNLVTGALAGGSAGAHDVDGGMTTIRSPNVVLPAGRSLTLSFKYYLAHHDNGTSDDFLRVKVVGVTTVTVFEEFGAGDYDEAAWEEFTTDVSGFAGQTVYLLIEAADGREGSLIEAAIDDVVIQ